MRNKTLGVLALAATFGFAGVMPAQATPHVREDVCLELDSGKIDTVGDPLSVTVTAPEGMVITGYCVKAGSINQGDGPIYFDGLSLTSLVISYPSGKAVSHYSVSYGPALVEEEPVEEEPVEEEPSVDDKPPVTFIVKPLPLPRFVDKCGTADDEVILQEETDKVRYYYDEVRREVVAQAKEENGYILQQDIQFKWPNTNTDVPCEVVASPVDEQPPAVTPPNENVTTPIGNETPAQASVPSVEEEVETPLTAIVPAIAPVNASALEKEWKRPTFNTGASSAVPVSASVESHDEIVGLAAAAFAVLLLVGGSILVYRRRV